MTRQLHSNECDPRKALLAHLRREIAQASSAAAFLGTESGEAAPQYLRGPVAEEKLLYSRFSTGWPALDTLLPQGGLHRGCLVECLAASPGSGATTVACQLAWRSVLAPALCVVVDDPGPNASDGKTPRSIFFPWKLCRFGGELSRTVIVRPASLEDRDWAFDQALRFAGTTVIGWFGRLAPNVFRRLQLAAEKHRTCGVLVRDAAARDSPTWADVRLWVEPLPSPKKEEGITSGRERRLRITVLSCRGSCLRDRQVEVKVADESDSVYFPAQAISRATRKSGAPAVGGKCAG